MGGGGGVLVQVCTGVYLCVTWVSSVRGASKQTHEHDRVPDPFVIVGSRGDELKRYLRHQFRLDLGG